MDLALKNGFSELSFDEMEMVDGGFIVGAIIAVGGFVLAEAIEYGSEALTGKKVSRHLADLMHKIF